MLNSANFVGVLVYLWSVDEKHPFLQTNLQKKPSEKNVPNCSSVNLNVGYLLRIIIASHFLTLIVSANFGGKVTQV
jgi:hypothetical protein